MNELKIPFNTTQDAEFTLFCELLMNNRASTLDRLSKEEIAERILSLISCSYIALSYGHLLDCGSEFYLDDPKLGEALKDFIELSV